MNFRIQNSRTLEIGKFLTQFQPVVSIPTKAWREVAAGERFEAGSGMWGWGKLARHAKGKMQVVVIEREREKDVRRINPRKGSCGWTISMEG